MDFLQFVEVAKPMLNNAINKFNDDLLNNCNDGIYSEVNQFVKLNSGGKLVRGLLVILGYVIGKNYTADDITPQNLSKAINLALAVEVFQTAVLVQDDVIDQDDKRRGIQTIHSKIANENGNTDIAKHYANSVAICVGDLGIASAMQLVLNSYSNNSNMHLLANAFVEMKINTYVGELLDVKLSFNKSLKSVKNDNFVLNLINFVLNDEQPYDMVTEIINMYKLKTADYTIYTPLRLGLILSGAKIDEHQLKNFARLVGVAFQIQDDYLGIYGDMQKDGCSDIKEGKKTLLYAVASLYNNDRYKLNNYYGKQYATQQDLLKVRQIFEETGAKQISYDVYINLFNNAKTMLLNLPFANKFSKDLINSFIDYLQTRNK